MPYHRTVEIHTFIVSDFLLPYSPLVVCIRISSLLCGRLGYCTVVLRRRLRSRHTALCERNPTILSSNSSLGIFTLLAHLRPISKRLSNSPTNLKIFKIMSCHILFANCENPCICPFVRRRSWTTFGWRN